MIRKLRENAVAILCVCLILLGFVVVGVQTFPIDVLKDWKISVADAVYKPGGQIVVESHSVKLRKADGKAQRVIECDTKKDSVVGYQLNEADAKRLPGFNSNGTVIIIPAEITNLPTKCRVVITVDYTVFFGLRHVTEYAVSNDFNLK